MDDDLTWTVSFPSNQVNGVFFTEGKRVDDWNPNLIGTYVGNYVPMDFLLSGTWPIFSKRMADFVQEVIPGAIQFLPFRLQDEAGNNEVLGHSIGQILSVVDCIDKDQTKVRNDDWTPRPNGEYRVIPPLVLRRSSVQNERVFRIMGNTASIVVREDVRDSLAAQHFVGLLLDEEFHVTG